MPNPLEFTIEDKKKKTPKQTNKQTTLTLHTSGFPMEIENLTSFCKLRVDIVNH